MPRISPVRLFKSHYPNATIEIQRRNFGKPYYLVRKEYGAIAWTGCGDTKAQAWADACKRSSITALKEAE